MGVPITGEKGSMQGPDGEVPLFGLRFKDGPDEYLVLLNEEQKNNITGFWNDEPPKPVIEIARTLPG